MSIESGGADMEKNRESSIWKLITCAALLGGIALVAAATRNPVFAQNSNSGVNIGPSTSLSTTAPQASPSDNFPKVEHLFGDWGGVRTDLGKLGINVLFDYTSESAGNVSGGKQRDFGSAYQLGLEIDIDWQKLAGLQGFATHTVLVNRGGSNASEGFGDNLLPAQEIFGAGGDVAVHLVYIYGEETLFDGRLDISAGVIPVGNDFAASPLNCNFMNNGLCGNPKELSGGDLGFSAWPDATIGGRVRGRPTDDTYVQIGLYGVDPFLYSDVFDRTGFDIDPSRYSGVEVPVELAWEPKFGENGLLGHYKIGFGYDSSPYTQFLDANGNPPAPPAMPAETGSGKFQFWALADQMLIRQGDADTAGLIALAGYIHSNPGANVYHDEAFAGFVDGGFWKARPNDTIGLLFTYQTVSNQLTSAQQQEQEFGLPFSNNATGVQTHEEVLEANYDIHVFRGVNFEPDFQYIFHPNAQDNLQNAAVFGFKTHIEF
jgi:porin